VNNQSNANTIPSEPDMSIWDKIEEDFYDRIKADERAYLLSDKLSNEPDSIIHGIIVKAIQFGIELGMKEQQIIDAEGGVCNE
jgi:hypothetical protein